MCRKVAAFFTVFISLVFVMGFASNASAESRAFQLSLTPDLALHDSDVRIRGVSLGIWSENPQHSLTLGFVSGSTGDSSGFSWSFFVNYADSYKGVHWAPVNYTKQDFVGWQNGLVNYTKGNFKGFQSAMVNYAGHLKGLQLGFVNYAETATSGVQVGFVNIIPENRWFRDLPSSVAPGMVIANWRF